MTRAPELLFVPPEEPNHAGIQMKEHEYALIHGINRSKVGRYIAGVAALVAGLTVLLALLAIDVASFLGWNVNVPPTVLSLLITGTIYLGLYAVFDRHAWRWPWLSSLLRVPDLSGCWACEGTMQNREGTAILSWDGDVTIVQTWDKVRVRLKTSNSGSNSINAALIHDSIDGYRLIYNYENDPRPEEPDLRPHLGFAQLTFSNDLRSAEGTYFNGHGRYTFGRLHWTKKT